MLDPVPNPGALAYDGLDASALEALRELTAFAGREIIPKRECDGT